MIKKKMDAYCYDVAQNSVSTRLRIARVYDFLERKGGSWRIFPLPATKEVVFPQILSDDQKLTRKSSDDSVEFTAKNPTKLRLFGVDHQDRTSRDIQYIITVDDQRRTTENPSRKRKSRSPSSTRKSNYEDSEELKGETPTKIRLFGNDIPVDHHNVRDATASREIQDTVSVEENPSSRKSSQEDSEEFRGKTPPKNHNVSREIQDMLPADENSTTEESHSSRNPNLIILEGGIILEQHRVLLFEKKLEFSDVSSHQNRLLITKGDCKQLMAFLTEEEKSIVMNKSEYLRVLTTGGDGVEYTLHLKLWAASGSIVLKHQWSKLVAANGWRRGDSVQVWGYRVNDELRLEIVIN